MRRGRACIEGTAVKAGDLVEVLSKKEILATLDSTGRLDALPFMPEMLKHCGRRFRVSQVAHKTCDTATFAGGREMHDAVFLDDLRCDGSAHCDCQARCLFFWKTQWLTWPRESVAREPRPQSRQATPLCDERQLLEATHAVGEDGEMRYSCQATAHLSATVPLKPLAPWHFVADLRAHNVRLRDVIRVVGLHLVWRLRSLPFGWRFSTWLYARLHQWITGRPDPTREGLLPEGASPPTEHLDLQPGELVEVKSHDEILKTVDRRLRNRGLGYNSEMTPACGHRYRVAQRVTRIVDEKSGHMIRMKHPCITLEGVYCQSQYTHYSLLCSRRVTPYFREVWLKRSAPDADKDRGAPASEAQPKD